MASSVTRFLLSFRTSGHGDLVRLRSVIKGVGEQSYISFNQASRSVAGFERTANKTLSSLTRSFSMFRGSLLGFAGLGLGGGLFGGLLAGMFAFNRAFIQTNTQIQASRIMMEEMLGSAQRANQFIGAMQNLSADFGNDMSEVMKSSRGILQMMKQLQSDKQPMRPDHLEKVMKMVMAVSAMDLENRGLSYTAYAFKESMTGQGLIDWKSMRNRLEINLGRTTEQAITKAFKAKDIDKGLMLFEKGLERIGINSSRMLARLSQESMLTNISRFTSYMTRGFQVVGEKFYYSLIKPFARLNNFIARNFSEGSTGMKILTKLGDDMNKGLTPIIDSLNRMGKSAFNDRLVLANRTISAIKENAKAGASFLGLFASFFDGVMGRGKEGSGLYGLLTMLTKFGIGLKNIFTEIRPAIYEVGQAIGMLGNEIGKITGNAGGGVGGLLKFMLNTATGAINVATAPLMAYNNFMGNSTGNPIIGDDTKLANQSSTAQNINTMVTALMGMTMLGAMGGGIFGFARKIFGRGKGIAGVGGATGGVAGASAGEAGLASAGRIYSPLVDIKTRRMDKIAGLNLQGQSVANANINMRVQNAEIMRRMSVLESKIAVEKANLSLATRPSDKLRSAMDIKSLENKLEANKRALMDNNRTIANNSKVIESVRGKRAEAQGQINALEKKIESIMNPIKQMSLTEKMTASILGLGAISNLLPLFTALRGALSPLTANLTFTGSTLLMFASRISLVTALMYTWYQSFQTMKWNEIAGQNKIDVEAMKTEVVLSRAERLRLKEENVNLSSIRKFMAKGFLYDKKTDSGYGVTSQNFPLAYSMQNAEGQRQISALAELIRSGGISKESVIRNLGEGGYQSLSPQNFGMNIQGSLNVTKMDDKVKKELAEYIAEDLKKRRSDFALQGGITGELIKIDSMTDVFNNKGTLNTTNEVAR